MTASIIDGRPSPQQSAEVKELASAFSAKTASRRASPWCSWERTRRRRFTCATRGRRAPRRESSRARSTSPPPPRGGDPRPRGEAQRGRRGARHPRPAPPAEARGRGEGDRAVSPQGRGRLPPRQRGRLMTGGECFLPCTPYGILRLLDHEGGPQGKHPWWWAEQHRGEARGDPPPAAPRHLTICHSRTVDLPAVVRSGDVVVAAVGRRRW